MPQKVQQYRPNALPQSYPGETADDYLKRLVPWLRDEFNEIYKDYGNSADITIEKTAPRLPFDGMMRYFRASGGGWSPTGSDGLFFYIDGNWYQINLSAT
jgi:hypothetical protein